MFKAVLLLAGTVLYLISPIDFCPDFIPVLGQADDAVALLLGASAALRSWSNDDSNTFAV